MDEHKLNWSNIKGIYNFEGLVTTLIFLKDLLHIESVKTVQCKDLYWVTWQGDEKKNHVYRILFKSYSKEVDKQDDRLQRKFDEKIKPILEHEMY